MGNILLLKRVLWIMTIFLTWSLVSNVYDKDYMWATLDIMVILWNLKTISEMPNV